MHHSLTRTAWGKLSALILLAVLGLGGGLYLANMPVPPVLADTPVQRFPLTEADIRDNLEAPTLTTDASGAVYLAWASRTGEEERTLFLARSSQPGQPFAPPRAITRSGIYRAISRMKGKTVTRELRMVPHLLAAGSTLHLAWTEKLPDEAGVRMVLAASTDRGDTFAPPVSIHSGAGARPTFTALSVAQDGSLLASWLDNRKGTQQCFSAYRPANVSGFFAEQVVHSGDDNRGVCPCCPTSALLTPDGTRLVAFRNLDTGHRDIAIGVQEPGQESFTLHPVVPPTWEFNGCPHDGPSLALVGDTLHVAWMDAHTGSPRCYHARARLSEMTFTTQELHPISTGTQGNARLLTDAQGTLHAVWEESLTDEPPPAGEHRHEPATPTPGIGGRGVMLRSWPVGASGFNAARAVHPVAGAFQTRPTLTATPDGSLVLAWNELDESGKAVVVKPLNLGEDSR